MNRRKPEVSQQRPSLRRLLHNAHLRVALLAMGLTSLSLTLVSLLALATGFSGLKVLLGNLIPSIPRRRICLVIEKHPASLRLQEEIDAAVHDLAAGENRLDGDLSMAPTARPTRGDPRLQRGDLPN